MVFIDGSNLYHSMKGTLARTDLDFEKFCLRLGGNRKLIRAYYYSAVLDQTIQPDPYRKQQQFLEILRRVPRIELRMGRLVYSPGFPGVPPKEKGVDVRLATDMVAFAAHDNYDVAILVSADGDFAEAIQHVKNFGKNVEVALFGTNTSRVLRDVADDVVALDASFFSVCWR